MSSHSRSGIAVFPVIQGSGHLAAKVADEHARVQRLALLAVVLAASLLEVRRQVFIGVSPGVGAKRPRSVG